MNVKKGGKTKVMEGKEKKHFGREEKSQKEVERQKGVKEMKKTRNETWKFE